MSKWENIRKALYSSFEENTKFTKEEIVNFSIEQKIVDRTIRANTWNALFTHNILSKEEENLFSLNPVIYKNVVKKTSPVKRGERQAHGFIFEDYIKKELGIEACPKGHYTYKWDGMLNGIPVSIKTEKYGSDIEMASFTRNAYNTDSFYLIVGFWEEEKTNIVSIEILLIPGDEWHSLFSIEIVNKCQNLIDTISNSVEDDQKWKESRLKLSKEWKEKTSNLVRPRFKRDHKSQKRMQCAINNKDFYSYFLPKYKKELI